MKKLLIFLLMVICTSTVLAGTLDPYYGCSDDMSLYPSSGEGAVLLFENCSGSPDGTSMDGRLPQVSFDGTVYSMISTHKDWQIKDSGDGQVCRSVNIDSDDDRFTWDMTDFSHNVTLYFGWNVSGQPNIVHNYLALDAPSVDIQRLLLPRAGTQNITLLDNVGSARYTSLGEYLTFNEMNYFKIIAFINSSGIMNYDVYRNNTFIKRVGFSPSSAFEKLEINVNYQSSSKVDIPYILIVNGSQGCTSQSDSLNITFINCTSCGGDTIPPYETEDTTPTFNITTNKEALCAIADEDLDYTEMITAESYRNCSTTGSSSHVCTLHPYDALIINESDYAYIACTYNNDVENDSVALEVSMTSSQVTTQGVDAIQAGIDTSSLVTKTVYDNQQVYIVNANNDQILTTFDKFVESGNKRWAFNYLTSAENFISGLFNLTSTFFAAEYKEKTFQEVNDSVRTMIDETS